jgi:DNA-binding transcriptional ArsR family regulator
MKAKGEKVEQEPSAPFAYEGLDRVIHERARLGILTSLLTHPGGLSFADLKQLCGLTDGNLSRHLSVLEENGIVAIAKGTERNRSLTLCRITAAGRKRFLEYLATLEGVVQDAAAASKDMSAGNAVHRLTTSQA